MRLACREGVLVAVCVLCFAKLLLRFALPILATQRIGRAAEGY